MAVSFTNAIDAVCSERSSNSSSSSNDVMFDIIMNIASTIRFTWHLNNVDDWERIHWMRLHNKSPTSLFQCKIKWQLCFDKIIVFHFICFLFLLFFSVCPYYYFFFTEISFHSSLKPVNVAFEDRNWCNKHDIVSFSTS